jgi:hypothetical protein
MKMDPLAGLATPALPGKKKPMQAGKTVPVKKAQKTQGAPKPVPQNFSPIRNARS